MCESRDTIAGSPSAWMEWMDWSQKLGKVGTWVLGREKKRRVSKLMR